MFIDLHVHTEKYSTCSYISPYEALMAARAMRIDGIAIMEHDTIWDKDEIEEIKEKFNDLVVLRGQEISTYNKGVPTGHILTFGFYETLHQRMSAQEIIRLVHNVGGITIAAHPFRESYGLGELIFDLDIDAIESLNSRTSVPENNIAEDARKRLNLPAIGGSDAHTVGRIGKALTFFEAEIHTEIDLIREILKKACIPVNFSEICAKQES